VPQRLLPFLGVVSLLTILPGPDIALVVRNGVRGGQRAAWLTGLGCWTGIATWAATSVVGLTALLAASSRTFDVLRVAGAVYLAVLGAGSLRSAFASRRGQPAPVAAGAAPPAVEPARARPPDARTHFRQGLVSTLLNPKIALLFVTLLPQFVAPGEARARTTALLALVIMLVELLWWRLFSLAVGAIGRALDREPVRRTVEGLAGVVLVGLAVRVAVER
jgi:threonine/homoserine/homoserine lactone efflux protein